MHHEPQSPRFCAKCRGLLPADAPEGNCPRCLLALVNEANTAIDAVDSTPPEATFDDATVAGGPDPDRPTILRHSMEHCEVIDEIARGGMGIVYRVRDHRLGRVLAMKVMSDRGQDADPRLRRWGLARFIEEARVTAQLDHPGIVSIHEVGMDRAGRPCFTMKLVKGRDLNAVFEWVRAGRDGWNLPRALGVLVKVCQAMGYAHSKRVVHRDLKPSNIMVGRFGEVHVMDWGLAKVAGQVDGASPVAPQPLPGDAGQLSIPLGALDDPAGYSLQTRVGAVMGTPSYMPPEQARGDMGAVDAASDVYALGAILYTLLAGRPPYHEAEERVEPRLLLARVLDGPPKPLHRIDPQIPSGLVAISEKAMAREKAERYGSSLALAEDLQAYLDDRVVKAYRTGPVAELTSWLARNRRLSVAVGAAVLVALLGLVAFIGERERAAGRLRRSLYAADMKLAHDALEAGNRGQAVRLVGKYTHARGAADPRGIEWRHLWQRCQGREEFTLEGAKGRVIALAFSADGRSLYSGSNSGELLEWDVGSRAMVRRVPTEGRGVYSLAALPGGSRVVASLSDGVHVRSGPELRTDERLPQATDPLSLSPDGRLLATGGTNAVMLWDTQDWRRIRTWRGFPQASFGENSAGVTRIEFSRDGSKIAAGVLRPDRAWVYLWDTASLMDETVRHPEPLVIPLDGKSKEHWDLRLAFSRDGRRLALAVDTLKFSILQVRAVEDGRLLGEGRLPSVVTGLAFSDDGDRLVVTSFANDPSVWELTEGGKLTEIQRVPGHWNEIWALAMSPDRQVYATGCKDGSIKLWRAEALFERPRTMVRIEGDEPVAVGFVSGGRHLAALGRDGVVSCWDSKTLLKIPAPRLPDDIRAADFAPDGRHVVVLRSGGELWLCPVSAEAPEESRLLQLVPAKNPPTPLSVAWSGDGRRVVVADERVVVWDVATGQEIRSFKRMPAMKAMALSRDGRRFAVQVQAPTAALQFWDVGSGRFEAGWEFAHEFANRLCFSPDGQLLAAASMDNQVTLWEVPTGRLRTTLAGHTLAVWDAWFSADGRTLITSGSDALRFWNLATAQEVSSIETHNRGRIRLAPDDSALAIPSGNELTVVGIPSLAEILAAESGVR